MGTAIARLGRLARSTGRWSPWLVAAVLAWAGCAGPSRIAVPPELPNRTDDQGITFRWALLRDDGTVRAVGLAEAPGRNVSGATLALYGTDGGGRIVSRGQGTVSGGFGEGALPFEVVLRPTGAEERFLLRVVHFVDEIVIRD